MTSTHQLRIVKVRTRVSAIAGGISRDRRGGLAAVKMRTHKNGGIDRLGLFSEKPIFVKVVQLVKVVLPVIREQ